MNKPEKILMSCLIVILVGSASFLAFLFGYYYVQVDTKAVVWHDIWIDNGETVANRTTTIFVYYRNDYKILYHENEELYRSQSASDTIQWTINHSKGDIFLAEGTYNIDKTILVDSNTALWGYAGTYLNATVTPVITVVPNAENVTFSNLNVTIIEGES